MENKKKRYSPLLTAGILAASMVLGGCSGKDKDSRNTDVYEDMQSAFEQSGLRNANIGLFSKTELDGSVTYGECGSGVIFRQEGNDWYALTAAHVVGTEDSTPLVFTVNTEMKTEEIPGIDSINVLARETYESMYEAEVLYVSSRDDLAVIRFSADEDLAVVNVTDTDPEKGDRIMCIGNPESEWFAVSYGTVTSGIEKFGEMQNYPSNAMKHTAYINVGSSGGAALNEKMELAGITPGASLSPDGTKFYYGVMIPVSEIRLCLAEWEGY